MRGHEAVARLLLEKGANVNARSNIKATPLYWAAQANQKKMVEFLVSRGADVTLTDEKGDTPRVWAGKEGHKAVAELLSGLEKWQREQSGLGW
jgi:ankyrin repeat protein